jgi:molecular chaperone DnaK
VLTAGPRLGIDFGTSHTVAVLMSADRILRPLLFDGSPLLPSAVYAEPDGRLLIGRDAWHSMRTAPARFEPYPKQRIDEGAVLLGEAEVPVAELIAAVLRRVAGEAARVSGDPPVEAVLTCPSGWGPARREVLHEAAAGVFARSRLVAEPVAAACYFVAAASGRIPVGGYAAVYDFGAGTFDASVVRRTADGFEVLAERGLSETGGLDIDAAIVADLGETYAALDPVRWDRLISPVRSDDQRLRRTLWDDVRAAKEILARTTATMIHLPLFDVDVPITREQLDEAARPIVQRTVDATRAAIDAAGVRVTDLAGVFLVGGSSRLQLAGTLLHRGFGMPVTITDQPELVVAEGSLHAAVDAGAGPGGPATAGHPMAGNPATGPAQPGVRWPSAGPAVSGPLPPAPHRPVRTARVAAAVVLALLLAAAGVWVLTDRGGKGGSPDGDLPRARTLSAPTASPSPSPSLPSPSLTPAQCLIGTWRQTANRSTWTVGGRTVELQSSGTINRFRADGTVVVEYLGAGVTRTGTSGGNRYEITSVGTITFTYFASDHTIYFRDAKAIGTLTTKVNGRVVESGNMVASLEPEDYTCSGDTLRFWNSRWTIDAVRLSTTT